MGLYVVGGNRQLDIVTGGKLQLSTNTLAVVTVNLLTVGLVMHIAVIATEQGGQRAFEGLGDQAPADTEAGAAFVAAEPRLINVTMGFGGWCSGDDVQHASRRVLSE